MQKDLSRMVNEVKNTWACRLNEGLEYSSRNVSMEQTHSLDIASQMDCSFINIARSPTLPTSLQRVIRKLCRKLNDTYY